MVADIEVQEKKIIADEYRRIGSYAGTARAVGCSPTTVRNIVLEEKREHEYLNALPAAGGVEGYLRAKQGVVLAIVNKCLAILNDDEKLHSATLPQIASAMTTLLEKFTISGENLDSDKHDSLTKSLMEMAEWLTKEYEESGTSACGGASQKEGDD